MKYPLIILFGMAGIAAADDQAVDFNRDIRSILSNNCYACHGPDADERQAGLRLDVAGGAGGAYAETDSGSIPVVPGKPADSELIARVTSSDDDLRMPPADFGKQLSADEIRRLTDWVKQGARYAKHWSYERPVRREPPAVKNKAWPRGEIDRFLLARLEREGLSPSPAADRYALARRVSLDLTGLPPTVEEVDAFVNDQDPHAYEKLVDRLLEKRAFGEHWARMWLDLARYADSAGYADDPPRTIWGFRDWVIRALNANMPFDQFTIEQIAGDLLPNPTDSQRIATAFHRNTLTNNEGGTNDEEFRNVAIVDRVNTTMAVWMGTTISCAQCHNHKYDPISQEEFFRMFAVFNSSEDADRRNEAPLLEVWTDEQLRQKTQWQQEIDRLANVVATATPPLQAAQQRWESEFQKEPAWSVFQPAAVESRSKVNLTVAGGGSVAAVKREQNDVYTVSLPIAADTKLSGLQLEVLPSAEPGAAQDGGKAAARKVIVSRVAATLVPPSGGRAQGRFVRVELPGKDRILSLAEVQVFNGANNVATTGEAKQSTTDYEGHAKLAIDGNTNGHYFEAKSTTHSAVSADPWWEVDLKSAQPVDRILVWNRTDGSVGSRLANFKILLLDDNRQTVWETTVAKSPAPKHEESLSGVRAVTFAAAYADRSQAGFDAANVLNADANKGWTPGDQAGEAHRLTLIPAAPVDVAAGSVLKIRIEQLAKAATDTLGHFRLMSTSDARISAYAKTPANILAILNTPADRRVPPQQQQLTTYYLTIAPELKADRDQLARVKKQLAEIKPGTTVPVMRELSTRRKTHIQRRGNFQDLGAEVTSGLPHAFHAVPDGEVDRLVLARWLVDEANPLTSRVIANRFWEAIFGVGIVRTSEEFGSQGELPVHPELLDWLATEVVRLDWDVKAFLKLLVTSAAYQQVSAVDRELYDRDPENRLLARGPRFRLSAEMIRDQALFASGLLSDKMFGAPVKPPQPKIGLTAAFGSGIDWTTSAGEDKFRRGLYTTWRRSNPYPSMAAFDAPNREVCIVRRDRTNTPLQALVTLNDPVYIEAAQSLARRLIPLGTTTAERATAGFRVCLSRPPKDAELKYLVDLHDRAYKRFAAEPERAGKLATVPLGPAPKGSDIADLAAWTVVGNVLLNLDEMFLKR